MRRKIVILGVFLSALVLVALGIFVKGRNNPVCRIALNPNLGPFNLYPEWTGKTFSSVVTVGHPVFFDTQGMLGTGFYIEEGRVVTADHVIYPILKATYPGFPQPFQDNKPYITRFAYPRETISVSDVPARGYPDLGLDLAILAVSEAGEGIPLPLGDFSSLREGDPLYTIGYTVYEGKLCQTFGSGTFRGYIGSEFFLTSAPSTPGNSGGPVLNERGEVVGVIIAGTLGCRIEGTCHTFFLPITYALDLLGGGDLESAQDLFRLKLRMRADGGLAPCPAYDTPDEILRCDVGDESGRSCAGFLFSLVGVA